MILFLSIVGFIFTCFWLLGFGAHLYFNRQFGFKVAFWLFEDDARMNHLLTNRWWGYTVAWLLMPLAIAFQVFSEPDESVVEDTVEVDTEEGDTEEVNEEKE